MAGVGAIWAYDANSLTTYCLPCITAHIFVVQKKGIAVNEARTTNVFAAEWSRLRKYERQLMHDAVQCASNLLHLSVVNFISTRVHKHRSGGYDEWQRE
jgi:hypothetical protein